MLFLKLKNSLDYCFVLLLCLLVITTVFAQDKQKIEEISIFDLMNKISWQEYKEHISSCEICSDSKEKYKMCPECYYLVDAARPYISNDQMKLMALEELIIVSEPILFLEKD